MTTPRFIFKPTRDGDKGNDFNVSVARDADDDYGMPLGRVQFYDHKKPGYWKLRETCPDNLNDHVQNVPFDTKEQAASFLYLVHRKAEEYRTAKPLSDDVCRYLENRADDLQKEVAELRRRFFEVQIERYFLRKLAERNQIKRVIWTTDDSDKAQLVRDLMNLEVYIEDEKRSVPFVSEVALYNLIGKEDARTVLALIGKLCEVVAPDAMDEIEEEPDEQ